MALPQWSTETELFLFRQLIPPHCTTINGEYVVLSADSIANYQHVLLRLEVIMNTAFDKTLHHHSIGFRSLGQSTYMKI